MSNDNRQRALRLLSDHENESHTAIHNAIIDLRRNAERSDVRILQSFLSHYDPMVVAATLYTLYEVHNQKKELLPLVKQLATHGDVRESDDLDRPIQCMAISCLADFGRKRDVADVDTLVKVAENQTTPATPRVWAWEELAQLFGVQWTDGFGDELVFRPASEASDRIRNIVRKAIAKGCAD